MSTEADHDTDLLSPEVQADLQAVREFLLGGRDINAKNVVGYLRIDVLPRLDEDARAQLSQQIAHMETQLELPRSRRFKAPTAKRARRRGISGFKCVYCRQRWGWDAAKELPNKPGHACTNCAKTVMCPSCGARKQDGYPTCYRCSGARGVVAKPHGFHL